MTPTAMVACLAVAADLSGWRSVPVGEVGGVSVRVWVRPVASLADPDWLAVEVCNADRTPVWVRNANYRFESERSDPVPGRPGMTGGLASGNDHELFGTSAAALRPGRTWCVRPVSDYSAALLGLPPPAGWRVRATFHLTLDLADGRRLRTPDAGVPFTFAWVYPDIAGFEAMRDRLRGMLARPDRNISHVYLLDALFKIPAVASAADRDRLLAGLAVRSGTWDGRWSVVRRLAARHPGDPAVIAYFRRQLAVAPRRVVEDLAAGGPWDPSFADTLLRLYADDPEDYRSAARALGTRWDRTMAGPVIALAALCPVRYDEALRLVVEHRADWPDPAGTAFQLGTAVRRAYPVFGRDVRRLDGKDLERWVAAARIWGRTGDPAAVAALRPALDDRRPIGPDSPFRNGMAAHPDRVCDVAARAIQTVAGLPEWAELNRFGRPTDAEVFAHWDRAIADLKARLSRGVP
jgi:hypothetical protein